MRRSLGRIVLLPLILCCSSCQQQGPRLYPVRGHVFLDGKPAEGALIVFQPVDTSNRYLLDIRHHEDTVDKIDALSPRTRFVPATQRRDSTETYLPFNILASCIEARQPDRTVPA